MRKKFPGYTLIAVSAEEFTVLELPIINKLIAVLSHT